MWRPIIEASLRPQRGAKIPEDHGCGMRRLILPSHRTRITANSFTTLINLISNGTPTQCRSWGLHELGLVHITVINAELKKNDRVSTTLPWIFS
jgi:hypothetical protein